MVRAIDADELEMFPYSEGSGTEEQIAEWIEQVGLSEEDTADRARLLCWKVIEGCINVVKTQPTLTPPNELLTIEQLREMDGEPVWVELYQAWALVEVKQNGSIMFYGNSFSCSYSRTWHVYRFRPDRRPPEGEA